jgi:hypothetical protein
MTGFINFAASEPLHSSASLRRETDETFFNELNRFAVTVFD